MAQYSQIRLELSGFDPDLLSAVLFQEGCSGIEEYSEQVWLVSFREELSSEAFTRILKRLRQLNPNLQPEKVAMTTHELEDWNAGWKKHFKPLKVGRRIWVAPPWEQAKPEPGELLVLIDPQMAFGTGSHETTRLMIESLEKYLHPQARVLDAGCGSGVLSILAKLLGAGTVFGFDIEAEAIENARHNAEINRVSDVEFRTGDQSVIPGQRFDLVLANINRQVLLEMLPALTVRLAENGVLILSGILIEDEKIMREALTPSLAVVEKLQKGEWLALVVRKLPRVR